MDEDVPALSGRCAVSGITSDQRRHGCRQHGVVGLGVETVCTQQS